MRGDAAIDRPLVETTSVDSNGVGAGFPGADAGVVVGGDACASGQGNSIAQSLIVGVDGSTGIQEADD